MINELKSEATVKLHGHKTNDDFEATGKIVFNHEKPSASHPVKETIELLGKTILGLAGFCYVLGVVVVSVHLRQYGINSLGLSQLSYVTAGIWTLVPVGLVLILISLISYGTVLERETGLQDKESKWKFPKKSSNLVGTIVGVIGIVGFVVEYFSRYLGLHLGWVNWFLIPLLGTAAALAIGTAVFNLTQSDTYKTTANIALGLGLAVFALLLSLWYVMLFATRTYGDIPSAIGGGGPSQVELVVTADGKPYLEGVGIKFAAGQNRTGSLSLILASEKEYVIIKSDGQAVTIPVDAVKLVIYER